MKMTTARQKPTTKENKNFFKHRQSDYKETLCLFQSEYGRMEERLGRPLYISVCFSRDHY